VIGLYIGLSCFAAIFALSKFRVKKVFKDQFLYDEASSNKLAFRTEYHSGCDVVQVNEITLVFANH